MPTDLLELNPREAKRIQKNSTYTSLSQSATWRRIAVRIKKAWARLPGQSCVLSGTALDSEVLECSVLFWRKKIIDAGHLECKFTNKVQHLFVTGVFYSKTGMFWTFCAFFVTCVFVAEWRGSWTSTTDSPEKFKPAKIRIVLFRAETRRKILALVRQGCP